MLGDRALSPRGRKVALPYLGWKYFQTSYTPSPPGRGHHRGCCSHLADEDMRLCRISGLEKPAPHSAQLLPSLCHRASSVCPSTFWGSKDPIDSAFSEVGGGQAWQEVGVAFPPLECLPFLASVLSTYSPPQGSMALSLGPWKELAVRPWQGPWEGLLSSSSVSFLILNVSINCP